MATHEQLNASLAILLGLNPKHIDGNLLQLQIRKPNEWKAKFIHWINTGCEVPKNLLRVNSTYSFNPEKFLTHGKGWIIEPKERDENSASLVEIDLNNVKLVSTLKPKETSVGGEDRLKRLKDAKHIRLGANHFFTLWNNKFLIPEEWSVLCVDWRTMCITFDGDVLVSPDGKRYVLCLCPSDGAYGYDCRPLAGDFEKRFMSAVLTSGSSALES